MQQHCTAFLLHLTPGSYPQVVIYGDGEVEPSKDNAVMLAVEACKLDLPMLLCQKLALLDFESRKDAAQVAAPSISPPLHMISPPSL